MGLYSEIARLPNDHLQLERATVMSGSARARSLCRPCNRTTGERAADTLGSADARSVFMQPLFYLMPGGAMRSVPVSVRSVASSEGH